jgi:hypothetical protein
MTTTTTMENEYLREALRYPCRCEWKMSPWQLGCTLCASGGFLSGGFRSAEYDRRLRVRHELTGRYAWAIPTDEALDAIAAWSPVVEIGAGTGYWAALLAARGADIVAYDEKPGKNDWCDAPCYAPVAIGTEAAVHLHEDRTLFLCWPPMTGMAARALEFYRGRRLVYIGEYSGGCTADDRFFRLLEVGWQEVRQIDLPQWSCIHDTLTMYERKRR